MPLWEQIAHRLRCRDEDFPRILSLSQSKLSAAIFVAVDHFSSEQGAAVVLAMSGPDILIFCLLDTANNASMRHTWGSSMHCENWSSQRAEQKRRKPCSMESYRAAVFSTKGIKLASSWERYSCRTEIKERVQCWPKGSCLQPHTFSRIVKRARCRLNKSIQTQASTRCQRWNLPSNRTRVSCHIQIVVSTSRWLPCPRDRLTAERL